MNFTIGCDPEIFVYDKTAHQAVSAFNMIPGDKKNPFKVEKGAVQVDGMALEFNINPASTGDEFVGNIDTVMQKLREMVPKNYEFLTVPTCDFLSDYLKTLPPEALEIGCDPDFNAWTGRENPRPDGRAGFRSAAGHIHVGWTQGKDVNDPDHIADCQIMVKALDVLVGLQTLKFDSDTRRRMLYGKLGAMRIKPYGVEWRTPANAWVRERHYMHWMFNAVMSTANNVAKGFTAEDALMDMGSDAENIQLVFNNGMRSTAASYSRVMRSYCEEHNLDYVAF